MTISPRAEHTPVGHHMQGASQVFRDQQHACQTQKDKSDSPPLPPFKETAHADEHDRLHQLQ